MQSTHKHGNRYIHEYFLITKQTIHDLNETDVFINCISIVRFYCIQMLINVLLS